MSKILLDEMPKTPKDCPFYVSGCDGMHCCRLMDDCSRHSDHVPCNFIMSKQVVIPLGRRTNHE